MLRRKDQQGEVIDFRDETVRKKLDTTTAQNVLFLVIATPVEEVGRDHDFDGAIIEPSSYRSIIQLAGRVLRHRPPSKDIGCANVGVMEYNWRGMQKYNEKECVINRPGFELESEDRRRLSQKAASAHSISCRIGNSKNKNQKLSVRRAIF